MVDFHCAPFAHLIDRMRLEFVRQQSIFDLPSSKWYAPALDDNAVDLSVDFHGRRAANPVGPAAGPHTQMAQNLVLCWLAGSRIIELKTVQVNDRLTIPRPCIDVANVGYNIEWSQELRIEESLDQYVQGAMLIHMLRQAPEVFGGIFTGHDLGSHDWEVIFDMSVGYDLAGIRSKPVVRFLEGLKDASASVERLRAALPARLGKLRDLDYPTCLSRSVTLSTFHGCPADEIERICEFLLLEIGVNVIVKMNPPMLGKEKLEHLLHDVLGYEELEVPESAYAEGLQFDESIEVCRRLASVAAGCGRSLGAKFCNTLEVVNHREVFPAEAATMYLSGPPLHVLTMSLVDDFRQAIGPEMPISFSAGVDRRNFAEVVACGFVPVTTCTDLLRPGGYGRLPAYLRQLESAMKRLGAGRIEEYLLDARGQRQRAGGDAKQAGLLNTSLIAAEARANERYRAARNRSGPKKIESHLTVFDCLSCDKCVPVCPNDANFVYEVEPIDITYRNLIVEPDGSVAEVAEAQRLTVEQAHQIANFADFCNHCGHCDTFCPEYDGPYIEKPSFFGSLESFEAAAPHDGFVLTEDTGGLTLRGRVRGAAYRLVEMPGGGHRFADGLVELILGASTPPALAAGATPPGQPHRVDIGLYHMLIVLLRGITSESRVHQVNSPFLAEPTPPVM